MAFPETESPPESAANAAAEDVTSKAERTTRPIMRASLSSISLAGSTQSRSTYPVAARPRRFGMHKCADRSRAVGSVSALWSLAIRRHRPDGLFWRVAAKASHVLRDAHAYMLISIPTATSTIFGAFQVIFSSFQVGGIDTAFSHHCMFRVVGAFKHVRPPTELRSR